MTREREEGMGKCEGEPAGESTRAGVWSMLNGAGGEEQEVVVADHLVA